ncbi:MAG TPA: prenyltransferase/squalene oxidase repeat-containing protein [Tepidisphaeraceae bacterium]|jgi:squalene-hopene/tetraprenyl-beta-curcumene cyclase
MPRTSLSAVFSLCLILTLAAAGENSTADGQKTIDKALAFLKTQQQKDGSFQRSDREPPAVTALVLKALARDAKAGPRSDAAQKAVDYLAGAQQANGGIYRDMLANYNTAISVSALASLNDPAQKERIARAVAYLKGAQFSDAIAGANGQKIDPNNPAFGGFNYGAGPRGGRPDISNTAIVIEALKDSGLKSDDPAYQNALKFITRLQNNSETNSAPWAGNDGGFVYSIGKAGEGESAAGEYQSADGKRLLRSYGSMTYAGLKSMIYAGLSKDDPRVKAAWDWVRSNWTLDEHPGMSANGAGEARSGIFYYYSTLAKALAVYGEPVITDKKGGTHDWRVELIAKLGSIQNPDGSFTGNKRWMEDNPTIATAFAVLALEDALQDLKDHPAR